MCIWLDYSTMWRAFEQQMNYITHHIRWNAAVRASNRNVTEIDDSPMYEYIQNSFNFHWWMRIIFVDIRFFEHFILPCPLYSFPISSPFFLAFPLILIYLGLCVCTVVMYIICILFVCFFLISIAFSFR